MPRRFIIPAVILFGVAHLSFAQEAVPLGSKDEAKWTRSTVAAATTRESKQILAGAEVATVVGEVIDVGCFLELGAIGPEHAACAADCIRHGQQAGILDERGNLFLLMAEQHDVRRNGSEPFATKLADLAGKRVAATGLLVERRGYRVLWLRAPQDVAPAAGEMPPEAPAAPEAPAPPPAQP